MVETPVPKEEMEIAFTGPAVFANKFYVSLNQGGARVAFVEKWEETEPPLFRAAVMMNFSDAIELYKLLQSMLKDIEGEIEKVKAQGNVK